MEDATVFFDENREKKYEEAIFVLNDVKTMYSRQVFNTKDLLGSLGGMSTVVFAIGSAIMS